MNETLKFLLALHGEEPNGYMTVCRKSPSGGFPNNAFFRRERAMAYSLEIAAKQDVWYSVNPLVEIPPPSKRGAVKDVKCLVACWIDIDIQGIGHKHQNLCPDEASAVALVASMPLEPTAVVHTGGGLHVYWFLDKPFEITNTKERNRATRTVKGWERIAKSLCEWKIDSTAQLACVLRLPGTQNWKDPKNSRPVKLLKHDYKRRYTIEQIEEHIPDKKETPRPRLKSKEVSITKRVEAWMEAVGVGQQGERNSTLFRLTKDLFIGWCLPEHEAESRALEWSQGCSPPMDQEEARKTIRSALSSPPEPGKPIGYLKDARLPQFPRVTKEVPDPGESQIDPSKFSRTDTGNAELINALFGDIIRHVPVWKNGSGSSGFMRYNRGIYQRDEEDAFVTRLCIESARYRGHHSSKGADRKWAAKSESYAGLNSAKNVFKRLKGVQADPEDFDADPWALNCVNGILDLKTAEIREHSHNEMHTKQVPVIYDSGAACPLWMEFLDKIMDGDNEMILFLQRWIGYNLTGSVREHAVCVFYGDGGNGKGTLCETLLRLLSGYGHKTSFSTFLQCRAQRPSEPTPHLAALKGARLVLASESAEDQALNEPLLKELSGGDTIHARELFGKPFCFEPSHKITMLTNHRPRVRGGDYGIWRRLMLVPFLIKIPQHEMDKDLAVKLIEELPGILRWAVIGCLQWQAVGLSPPAAVLQATSDYQYEEDPVYNFLRERCTLAGHHADAGDHKANGYFISSGDLFAGFKRWAEENNELKFSRWSHKKFTARVKQRSLLDKRLFFYHRFKDARGFVGVRFTTQFNSARSGEGWPEEGDLLDFGDAPVTEPLSPSEVL